MFREFLAYTGHEDPRKLATCQVAELNAAIDAELKGQAAQHVSPSRKPLNPKPRLVGFGVLRFQGLHPGFPWPRIVFSIRGILRVLLLCRRAEVLNLTIRQSGIPKKPVND